jgi:Ca2+-binding EF-hand superfamily protein
LSFEGKAWRQRSIGSIDLIKKLMNFDQMQRATTDTAAKHEWLVGMGEYAVTNKQIKQCLTNFSNFRYIGILQKAILAYFVTNVFTETDNDYFRKIFLTLNKKANGMLSRDEFLRAFWDIGIKSMSEIEVDKILSFVDNDSNGFVTFSEFLVASVGPNDILITRKLQKCFKLLDDDGSGAISVAEIQYAVGKQAKVPTRYWKALMDTVDADGNAEINFDEFEQLMKQTFTIKIVADAN